MNGKWLELLGQASLSAAVMILAVAVLRVRFRDRTPQRVYCLLWDIVLLRLLAPVPVPSPFSIQGLSALWTGTVPAVFAEPAIQMDTVEKFVVRDEAAYILPQAPAFPMSEWLALLWCAGMAVCAVWLLWGHLQSRSLYAMSLPVEDGFIRSWQDQRRLRRFVQVRRSDRISAPLTYGVLQPVVLLPGCMDLADRENLSYVLEHEYTHIRRFDTLRKFLLAAGLCLHWFNPLVWLMYILANQDIELACDEAVVRSGADRRSYALALLRMEEERGGQCLSGSHFSGHALEERIKAIMKRKNVSLAALLAVLVVMSVTTTVFATSAPEKKDNAPVTGFANVTAVTQDVLTISQGPDGEQYYSLDGGETWMSEERYHAQYGSWGDNWDIEWWTYEEYKEWLENEKKDLAGIIGSRGYTGGKGWFVWDQEMVDETIAMYEETLEEIKNGALYSKSITDVNGTTVENTVIASGTGSAGVSTEAGASMEADTEELLKSYRAFGVTGSEEDGLYYNGQLIRYLVDGFSVGDGYGINYVYSNESGVVDVHTIREAVPLSGGGVDPAGPLTAIVKKGDAGFDASLIDCALPFDADMTQTAAVSEAQGSAAGRGRTFEEIFAVYSQWGLQYNPQAANAEILTCDSQPVAHFADLKPDGSVFSYENPYAEEGLSVYTEYDENGRLSGLAARQFHTFTTDSQSGHETAVGSTAK